MGSFSRIDAGAYARLNVRVALEILSLGNSDQPNQDGWGGEGRSCGDQERSHGKPSLWHERVTRHIDVRTRADSCARSVSDATLVRRGQRGLVSVRSFL